MSLLDFIGMDAESRARRDTDQYKPGPDGGIERKGWEGLLDRVLQQEAAEGTYLATNRPGQFKITKDTKKTDLLAEAQRIKDQEALITTYQGLGLPNALTEAELRNLSDGELTSAIRKGQQTRRTSDYNTNPEKLQADSDREEGQRRYDAQFQLMMNQDRQNRLDRLDDRAADRDLARMRIGSEERMFNEKLAADARASKKERMMALIAGLTNLGGAFAI